MSFATSAVLACLATALLGYLVTQPDELRCHRFLKIGLSLPLVVLITSLFTLPLEIARGWFALWSVAILAFIWRSPIAHFGSVAFMRMLHGDLNRSTGIQADIAGARALYLDGDREDAITHLVGELEKEPLHYEGHLLLSEWLLERDGPARALGPIDQLLSDGALMGERRKHLLHVRENLENRRLVAALNAKT